MKRFFSFLVIILTLTMLSCKKDDNRPWSPHWGSMSATLEGQPWQYTNWQIKIAAIEVTFTDKACNMLQIAIRQFNEQGFLRQEFLFSDVPRKTGTFPITPYQHCGPDSLVGASFYTSEDDGDLGQDNYQVLESVDNYFTIDSFDTSTGEIKGNFQVSFIISSRSLNSSSDLPDRIRFTEGNFHTRILANPKQ